ncbi:MAG: FKBP-type peptidyl-prolyl cis-trans isomerase [Chitinophagaceae bacterium]
MKKIFFIIIASLFFASCLKTQQGCQPLKPESEASQINAYCTANNITPTIDPSGIYYQIINSGMGAAPTLNSKITISYIAKFTSDAAVDSSITPYTNYLKNLIPGWQIALPLIKKGGRIKMVVPSSLAYGCTGYQNVPPNAILYFDVFLLDVQ